MKRKRKKTKPNQKQTFERKFNTLLNGWHDLHGRMLRCEEKIYGLNESLLKLYHVQRAEKIIKDVEAPKHDGEEKTDTTAIAK